MRPNPAIFRPSFGLLLLAATLLSSTPVCGQEKQQEEKHSPRLIQGEVVELDESVVVGARIQWSLISWDESFEDRKIHAKGTLKSDKDGRFECKVDKEISKSRDLFLNVTLGTTSHFVRSFDFDSSDVWKETVDVGKLKLDRGVRVKGQLVSPVGSGTKLEYPTVSLYCPDGLEYGSRQTHFYRDLECDSDGKFECLVPNNQKLILTFQAENFAQTELEKEIKAPIPSNEDEIATVDIGSIKLEAGVSVVGTAKLRDGSPAKGVVLIVAEWGDKGSSFDTKSDRFEYRQVGNRSFTKTDTEGNFRFPPHQGKCTVLALKQGSSRKVVDGQRQVLLTDGEAPFFEPVDIDLEDKGPEVIVKLREVETVEISGTVYDAKGKPVSNAKIQHSWYCIFGPVGYQNTRTDKDGRYKIRLGKGFRPGIDLVHDGQEVAHVTAETVDDYPDLFFDSGALESPELNVVSKDVAHLNWELLPPKSRANSTLGRVGKAVSWLFSGE